MGGRHLSAVGHANLGLGDACLQRALYNAQLLLTVNWREGGGGEGTAGHVRGREGKGRGEEGKGQEGSYAQRPG